MQKHFQNVYKRTTEKVNSQSDIGNVRDTCKWTYLQQQS